MAVAYKCDRCGKYFDKNATEPKELGFHFNVRTADWRWMFQTARGATIDWSFTFCFSCMCDFNQQIMHAPTFRFDPNVVVEEEDDEIPD